MGTLNSGSATEGIEGRPTIQGPFRPFEAEPEHARLKCAAVGTRGKFSSIKRRENSLSGSELVFETSSLIVSLSSCLPYAQEMRPQG